MSVIYDSVLTNAYQNIAFERQLSELTTDEVTLFLWQNDNCVVIGRNQNPLAECNLKYLQENDITLSRRYSGGGAVFHDLGNVNYTLVMKEKDYSLEKAKYFLLKAFEFLKLDVEFSGRNDLTINGYKFSGQAYYSHNQMYVLHGTLMYDLDIATLGKCLTPSKAKLQSKGIKSVKSRVMNLKKINPELTIKQIKEALVKAFEFVYDKADGIKIVDRESIDSNLYEYIQSEDWLFCQSPKYNVELDKKFPFGNITLQLEIKRNKVANAKIFTDSLHTSWETLEKNLVNIPYDEKVIWTTIKEYMM